MRCLFKCCFFSEKNTPTINLETSPTTTPNNSPPPSPNHKKTPSEINFVRYLAQMASGPTIPEAAINNMRRKANHPQDYYDWGFQLEQCNYLKSAEQKYQQCIELLKNSANNSEQNNNAEILTKATAGLTRVQGLQKSNEPIISGVPSPKK